MIPLKHRLKLLDLQNCLQLFEYEASNFTEFFGRLNILEKQSFIILDVLFIVKTAFGLFYK